MNLKEILGRTLSWRKEPCGFIVRNLPDCQSGQATCELQTLQ